MPRRVNVKAVHLQSVAPEAEVYAQGEHITPRTITRELLGYEETDATEEAAVAVGSVGTGRTGRVEDVVLEEQLDFVHFALL